MVKQDKRKISAMIVVILLLIIGILTIFLYTGTITGESVKGNLPDYYSYTKAICNENSHGWLCQDYIIECRDNKTTSVTPITGAIIQNSKDWQDPRPEGQRNMSSLCG
jgi:hypothetical protein